MSVGEQPQGVVQECPPAGVQVVMVGKTALDVRESGSDAILMPLERGEVDSVGEVRGEELVAFGFQPCPVRGEVGELLVTPCAALVERGVHLGGEVPVVVLADRDALVGVCDEAFGQVDGHGASGAGGLAAWPEHTK
ncbi:MAG: hypothetical protein QM604_00430 [Microbacterium sp.]